MQRACLTALLLMSLAVAGCKTAPACPVQTRTDAAKALDDHADRQAGWQSIKAEARVTQWGRNGRIRGTVLMFLERPDRVRFDVMTQVGPAAVLTSDGETFQLSDLREGTFLHGPTCPENIARLLGISVDAENVLRLLTGDTPTIEATERRPPNQRLKRLYTGWASEEKMPASSTAIMKALIMDRKVNVMVATSSRRKALLEVVDRLG